MSHLTKSMENYIRIIYELSLQESGARISDIASKFGVSKASASIAAKSLQKKGLVWRDAARLVYLTSEGKKQAIRILNNFSVINDFLIGALHVDPNTAYIDACALEHVVSERTINALYSFLNRQRCHDEGDMLRAE